MSSKKKTVSPHANKNTNDEVESLTDTASQLSISGSAPATIIKELGETLTKVLKPHLIQDNDELKKEINTKVRSERDGKEKQVIVKRIANPLEYAMHFHEAYMEKVPQTTKILFVGMNPSPSSLTGIPFYEGAAMTKLFGESPQLAEWLKKMPQKYQRNETSESGQRFWEFVKRQFGSYDKFFRHCFIINYCPLIFMNEANGNVDLDGFNNSQESLLNNLMAISDGGLKEIIDEIKPSLIIGIGDYAYKRVEQASKITCYKILHPSPATGMTSEDWINAISKFLANNGYWKREMAQINKEEQAREKRNREE